MGRNTQLSLEDDKGMQIAVYKVPYGQNCFSKMEIKLIKIQKFVNGILILHQLLLKKVV